MQNLAERLPETEPHPEDRPFLTEYVWKGYVGITPQAWKDWLEVFYEDRNWFSFDNQPIVSAFRWMLAKQDVDMVVEGSAYAELSDFRRRCIELQVSMTCGDNTSDQIMMMVPLHKGEACIGHDKSKVYDRYIRRVQDLLFLNDPDDKDYSSIILRILGSSYDDLWNLNLPDDTRQDVENTINEQVMETWPTFAIDEADSWKPLFIEVGILMMGFDQVGMWKPYFDKIPHFVYLNANEEDSKNEQELPKLQ